MNYLILEEVSPLFYLETISYVRTGICYHVAEACYPLLMPH